MTPAVFEPTILASERPKTHALDSTATGIGSLITYSTKPEYTLIIGLYSSTEYTSLISKCFLCNYGLKLDDDDDEDLSI
jgi:hypothetical protein